MYLFLYVYKHNNSRSFFLLAVGKEKGTESERTIIRTSTRFHLFIYFCSKQLQGKTPQIQNSKIIPGTWYVFLQACLFPSPVPRAELIGTTYSFTFFLHETQTNNPHLMMSVLALLGIAWAVIT